MMGRRIWLLLRKLDEHDSLFFPIIVTIAEDEPALFAAEVVGLERRLVAMGRTGEEAERDALILFQGVVDHALRNNRPLGQELGAGISFQRVNIALEKAAESLTAIIDATRKGVGDEWRVAAA